MHKKMKLHSNKKEMKLHSIEVLLEAAEENEQTCSSIGFCIACGERADGVEPDAEGYECEACGKDQVFGVEEMILQGLHK